VIDGFLFRHRIYAKQPLKEDHVFGNSGNLGFGHNYSRHLFCSADVEQKRGIGTGETGDYDIRKDAFGYCGIDPLAGPDGGVFSTLEKQPGYVSLRWPRARCIRMDCILGFCGIS